MSDSNVPASFPSSCEVDGFIVHKLKLSEYALVFDKLQKIPELIAGIEGVDEGKVDTASVLRALPRILATALPEALEILAIATRTPKEELDEKMDLKIAVKCFRALFEVNDFLGVWEEVQQILPAKSKKN